MTATPFYPMKSCALFNITPFIDHKPLHVSLKIFYVDGSFVCTVYASGVQGRQKKTLNTLELELLTLVSSHMGAGN